MKYYKSKREGNRKGRDAKINKFNSREGNLLKLLRKYA